MERAAVTWFAENPQKIRLNNLRVRVRVKILKIFDNNSQQEK